MAHLCDQTCICESNGHQWIMIIDNIDQSINGNGHVTMLSPVRSNKLYVCTCYKLLYLQKRCFTVTVFVGLFNNALPSQLYLYHSFCRVTQLNTHTYRSSNVWNSGMVVMATSTVSDMTH